MGEEHNGILLEKIDNILSTVMDIKSEIQKHSDRLNDLDIKTALQEKEIQQLQNVNNKMWGIISVVVGGVALALAKAFIGI